MPKIRGEGSTWDSDPKGTYRKVNALINQDVKNGYLTKSEERRLRNAADKLYMKGRLKNRHE